MRESVNVEVLRLQEEEDGFGGAYQTLVPVPGSPFLCWIYRRQPRYHRLEGEAAPQGTVTTDQARIVSFRDPEVTKDLKIGDIAVLPPCIHTGQKTERVTLQHPRFYIHSTQWDIESGATPSRSDSDTRETDYPNG